MNICIRFSSYFPAMLESNEHHISITIINIYLVAMFLTLELPLITVILCLFEINFTGLNLC